MSNCGLGYLNINNYTNKSHCRSGLFCLLCLKSERHETRHVGPLGTRECLRPNRILNFDLEAP